MLGLICWNVEQNRPNWPPSQNLYLPFVNNIDIRIPLKFVSQPAVAVVAYFIVEFWLILTPEHGHLHLKSFFRLKNCAFSIEPGFFQAIFWLNSNFKHGRNWKLLHCANRIWHILKKNYSLSILQFIIGNRVQKRYCGNIDNSWPLIALPPFRGSFAII